MSFLFIIAIIIILYWRVYRFRYKIDDPVEHSGYMKEFTDKRPKEEYERVYGWKAIRYIGIFILTCGLIYYQWGFEVSLMYAVMPLNVMCVAWKTGTYYMTTTALVILTHILLVMV